MPPRSPRPPARAHPRSRGENASAPDAISCGAGSSPLTRGKQAPGSPQAKRCGLIPAHAGKTLSSRKCPRPIRAHPRSRGENAAFAASIASYRGSSPLTRGKHAHRPALPRPGRLIPAHAGKTQTRATPAGHFRAHPRSRGENPSLPALLASKTGSSPLTRGKRPHLHVRVVHDGLIPAHAGKTSA